MTSTPIFDPWLIPETSRSIGPSISSSQASTTQSAGVPSTAKTSATSSSREGTRWARTMEVRVMLAPTPLWSLSGATIVTSPTP